jgi:protein-S-isoprenylcysteine O-methyltransferase Ste14
LCIRGNFGLIGAPCQRKIKLSRVLFKIIGWVLTISFVASAYWIFPEYLGSFYKPYYQALSLTWPYLAGFFLCCILWEDPRSDKEYDDYYWLAYALLSFDISLLKKVNLKQHFLAWIVKLYFLPLMFVYLVGNSSYRFDNSTVTSIYDSVYNGIYFIDVAFVCVGYTFANNLSDTQIRSTEPTMLGWACTLICYQPFWSLIGSNYISYSGSWGYWLQNDPRLQVLWAFSIILCLSLYIWATISFGSRLSNLTHRGILICGPYKYLRHPAYIGKLASYFLIYVPFIGNDLITVIRHCILWGMLGGVYYLRAKTEEAHLRSIGPEYDMYAKEVTQNWKRLVRF